MAQFNDGDVQTSIRKVVNNFNTTIYSLANEPSLGMYRIQEHISVAVPRVLGQKQTLDLVNKQVEGACFDIEYDTRAVCDMKKSIKEFESVKESLKRAIETKMKMEEAAARYRSVEPPQGKESNPPPQRRNYGAVAKTTTPILASNQAQVSQPEAINSDQQRTRALATSADQFLKPKAFT